MRVGIIGLGAISPLHIRALQDCGQKITAICDVDAEKRKNLNAEFGLEAEEYSDYNVLLASGKVDVVHVCTPHYLHAEIICKALSAGIHVLSEKPLAINFEQLNAIEKAVNNSSATLGVCFQNRYNASVLYLKEFFKDKEIIAATANLVWSRGKDYYSSAKWRGKKQYEGGGVMINQAIHTLDLLQWFCGMPESVIARCSNNSLQGVIDVEDTAYGCFALKNEHESNKDGKTLSGFIRCPINLKNNYGDFFFYSEHLVGIMSTIFGYYPESIKAYKNAEKITVVFRYKDYDVTGLYVDKNNLYYAMRIAENGVHGEELPINELNPCFKMEFNIFYGLLSGEKQRLSYEDFIAPVFVLNAIQRSLDSGNEEKINKFEV